jgi:hypothetical protein
MKIELRKLSDLRPYEKNPRINDDAVVLVHRVLVSFWFDPNS